MKTVLEQVIEKLLKLNSYQLNKLNKDLTKILSTDNGIKSKIKEKITKVANDFIGRSCHTGCH